MSAKSTVESLTSELAIVQQAVNLFWDFKLSDTEKLLEEGDLYKKNCIASLHYAEVAFLKALLSEDKTSATEFQTRISATKKQALAILTAKGKKLPRAASDSKEDVAKAELDTALILIARVIQGEATLWDACLKFKLQQQVKGVYNLRKAWNYFDKGEAVRNKTKSYPLKNEIDCCLDVGLGFFHFVISIIPKEWLWIVEGVGFKPNRSLGLTELDSCIKANSIRTPLAMLHMIWINAFFFEDFEKAEYWLKTCLEKHPGSATTHYLGGYVYRKAGKVDESDVAFSMSMAFSSELPALLKFNEYDLATNLYLNRDWKGAAKMMVAFLASKDPPAPDGFKVFCTFQIAICYEMMNDKANALTYMKKVLPIVRKNYEYDEFAQRKAKYYIANGFTAFEKAYIIASIQAEICQWQGALATMNAAEEQIKNEEDKGCFLWMTGNCLHKMDNIAEAKAKYDEALALKMKVQKFVHPHCLVGLAEIHQSKGEKQEAIACINKAKSYSSYDYSQLLGWKMMKMLDTLK